MSTSKEESIGERLKKERLRCGWSQAELARLVGVSKPTIHNWEHDGTVPQPLNQRKLAEVFSLPIDEFTPQKENEEEDEKHKAHEQQKELEQLIPLADIEMLQVEIIGRENDKEAILNHIKSDGVRLVNLKGIGGVGKTRLAREVEKEFSEDGAWETRYVSLARISGGSSILPDIAVTLKVKKASDDLLEAVAETLKGMSTNHVLLTLDNLEHLLNKNAKSVRWVLGKLLEEVPKLKFLVTSRVILDVDYEYVHHVKLLAVPTPEQVSHMTSDEDLLCYPATKLFRRYVLAKNSLFPFTEENCRTIAQICVRLGGLPLAIKIAARWTTVLGTKDVLERVQNRRILKLPNDDPELQRQQSLEATFGWSYELLNEEQRRFFRRFSVFEVGCSFDAATRVCGEGNLSSDDALIVIRALLACSMLELEQEKYEDGSPRLEIHPLVREYAQSLLGVSEEYHEMKRLHRDYYLDLVEAYEKKSRYSEKNVIKIEYENILAALQWSYEDNQGGEAMLRFVGSFHWCNSTWRETLDWMNKALYRPGLLDEEGRPTYAQEAYAKALYAKGAHLYNDGNYGQTYGRGYQWSLSKSLELYTMLGMENSEYAIYAANQLRRHSEHKTKCQLLY